MHALALVLVEGNVSGKGVSHAEVEAAGKGEFLKYKTKLLFGHWKILNYLVMYVQPCLHPQVVSPPPFSYSWTRKAIHAFSAHIKIHGASLVIIQKF